MNAAVVTGANKGIGFAIVEKLSLTLKPIEEWTIYLTSRNKEFGQDSLKKLMDSGHRNIKYLQLDITDPKSRASIVSQMKALHPNSLKIWINNAGIAFKRDSAESLGKIAEITNETNYFSTVRMMMEILPVMAHDSNLVNVSSMRSLMALKQLPADKYREFMNLRSLEEVDQLVKKYNNLAIEGLECIEKEGLPTLPYWLSKMALTKATMIAASSLNSLGLREGILIVSCCPGYIDTDLSDHKGTLPIEKGALTPVVCATTRDLTCQGCFFNDQKKADWSKDSAEELVQ